MTTFDIAFVRIARKPEKRPISPRSRWPQLYVAELVIDELVDQQPLTVVKLRQHRSALNDYGLDREKLLIYKDDDDQEHVAHKPKAFAHRPCRDSRS
jgi:hypothetical protein